MVEKNCEGDPPKRLLTKPEVADFLSTSTRTVEVWMGKGYLPYVKIGHTVRFCREDILAQLKERNHIK